MPPPPPLGSTSQFVHIDSLAATLAKLNINIPIEDLTKVIHDVDEAKRAELTAPVIPGADLLEIDESSSYRTHQRGLP